MREQLIFVRDGVLCLQADDAIRDALAGLVTEAYSHLRSVKWEPRGWAEHVESADPFIKKALSGDIGKCVTNLVNLAFSDDVQYTFTKKPSGKFCINEHRDGAKNKKQKYINRYKLQIGIILEKVTIEDGPFVYWPGSHHLAAMEAIRSGKTNPAEIIRTDLELRNKFDPCQFVGEAGSVVLSHPLVTHGTAQNTANRSNRPMAFVRVGFDEDRTTDLFLKPWADFPGLTIV